MPEFDELSLDSPDVTEEELEKAAKGEEPEEVETPIAAAPEPEPEPEVETTPETTPVEAVTEPDPEPEAPEMTLDSLKAEFEAFQNKAARDRSQLLKEITNVRRKRREVNQELQTLKDQTTQVQAPAPQNGPQAPVPAQGVEVVWDEASQSARIPEASIQSLVDQRMRAALPSPEQQAYHSTRQSLVGHDPVSQQQNHTDIQRHEEAFQFLDGHLRYQIEDKLGGKVPQTAHELAYLAEQTGVSQEFRKVFPDIQNIEGLLDVEMSPLDVAPAKYRELLSSYQATQGRQSTIGQAGIPGYMPPAQQPPGAPLLTPKARPRSIASKGAAPLAPKKNDAQEIQSLIERGDPFNMSDADFKRLGELAEKLG